MTGEGRLRARRGSRFLLLSQSTTAVSQLLGALCDACAEAIRECDGLPDMIMGDADTAIFNFPIVQVAGSKPGDSQPQDHRLEGFGAPTRLC